MMMTMMMMIIIITTTSATCSPSLVDSPTFFSSMLTYPFIIQ